MKLQGHTKTQHPFALSPLIYFTCTYHFTFYVFFLFILFSVCLPHYKRNSVGSGMLFIHGTQYVLSAACTDISHHVLDTILSELYASSHSVVRVTHHLGSVTIPISQIWKLRVQKPNLLSSLGPIACKRQSWGVNSGFLTPKPGFFTMTL